MTCRTVLGAVVSLGFGVAAAFGQSSSSALPTFETAAESRPAIPSLSGTATQSLTLGLDAGRFLEVEPQNPSLLSSFYGANPSQPWKLSLEELSSAPAAVKLQQGLVISAAPEPSAIALLGLGGLVMVQFFRHRRSTSRHLI